MVLGDRTNKKEENGGQLTNTPQGVMVDNLLALKHTYIHIHIHMHIHIHIRIYWGFQQGFFEKQMWVTKRPFLDRKSPKPEIPVIVFFAFFFSFNNKKHKMLLKPLFL